MAHSQISSDWRMYAMRSLIMVFTLACSVICDAATITGKVTRIIDGDTICVAVAYEQEEYMIRLEDIDAPELSQEYGQEATAHLSAVLTNRTVCIEFSETDFFGRIIGTVYLEAMPGLTCWRDINLLLISEGYAWHYRKYSKSRTLARLEKEAREQRRGLWQAADPVAPWKHRAMRSKKGKRK